MPRVERCYRKGQSVAYGDCSKANPADPHLFHPEQVRTGERVARLDPPRPYWAGCARCGATVDLAGPARVRQGVFGSPSSG